MFEVKKLKLIVISMVLFGALFLQQEVKGSLITYSDELVYTLSVPVIGPLNATVPAPGPALTTSINVAGLFTITPGPRATFIGVSNLLGNSLPTDLGVGNDQSFSDYDFSFTNPQNSFGFTVANSTAPGWVGTSTFEVTIFNGIANVGSTTFSSPSSGEVFFGFKSTLAFDFLTLREITGDVQNATQFGGAADREFFGKFYVTPIPPAVLLGVLGLGVTGLKLRKFA